MAEREGGRLAGDRRGQSARIGATARASRSLPGYRQSWAGIATNTSNGRPMASRFGPTTLRTLYNSTDVGAQVGDFAASITSPTWSSARSSATGTSRRPPGRPGAAPKTLTLPTEGLAALEGLNGRYLEHRPSSSGETVIYRVLPATYSSGVAAGQPRPPIRRTGGPTSGGDHHPMSDFGYILRLAPRPRTARLGALPPALPRHAGFA